MDIKPLNTFDILAMLDVPVLPANQVRGYIDISMMVRNTNPAWIQDNGHWVAIISMFSDNLTLNDFFSDEMVRISSAFILIYQFNKLVLK